MQNTKPVLDDAAFARLKVDVGEATAGVLLQSLRQEIELAAEHITAGLACQDWASVETKAHALKSAAATFGAKRLSIICLEIEMAAKSGQSPESFAPLTAEFAAAVAATHAAFGWDSEA